MDTELESYKIEKLLRRDALADAEKITGKSYKDDGGEDEDGINWTSRLGLALHMQYNAEKNAALEAADDTHYGTTFDTFVRVAAEENFLQVYDETFPGSYAPTEKYQLWWNPEGTLVSLESFTYSTDDAPKINNAKLMYNWIPNEELRESGAYWDFTSSGHFLGGEVWIGDHDVRDGFRHKLHRLRNNGRFLPSWVEAPFLYFMPYNRRKEEGFDYKVETKTILDKLPLELQSRICHI